MTGRLLAVDVGNTQTTVGWFDGAILCARWRIATRVVRTSDELRILLRQLLAAAGHDPTAVRYVSLSSVVPDLTSVYADVARTGFGVEPLVITADKIRGITVDYIPPAAVGADRLCGMAAAAAKYGGALIVVDLGTATVFDVLTADNVYRGGLIAPGLATAVESLHSKTSLLTRVELKYPPLLVGNTTETAIQSGILNGAVAMIDGLVERLRTEAVPGARVIATGGFAELIAQRSRVIQCVEPDLVLEGIRIVTERQ